MTNAFDKQLFSDTFIFCRRHWKIILENITYNENIPDHFTHDHFCCKFGVENIGHYCCAVLLLSDIRCKFWRKILSCQFDGFNAKQIWNLQIKILLSLFPSQMIDTLDMKLCRFLHSSNTRPFSQVALRICISLHLNCNLGITFPPPEEIAECNMLMAHLIMLKLISKSDFQPNPAQRLNF